MTVEYNGRDYGHQQMWELIRKMKLDDLHVCFSMDDNSEWVASISSRSEAPYYLSCRGDAGDKTPFRALARAIKRFRECE